MLFIFIILPLPAWVMLGLWFGMQIVGGFTMDTQTGGIAYWEHSGGFIAGLLFTWPLWLRLGGKAFWNKTGGHPPHPQATYKLSKSRIPKSGKR